MKIELRIKNLRSLKSCIYNHTFAFRFPLSKANGQTGFTLVELIVYMGLLSILLLVFTDIFTSILDTQLSSRNTSSVADDGRYIYSRFIYDVNRAQTIVEPSSYGVPSSQMTITIDGQNYTYSLTNNILTLTDSTGTYALNGDGSQVTSLKFTKIGATSTKDTVQINFTIQGAIPNHGIIDKEVFQTTAGIR
jgi:type II secretory pathway pseudopilin PulG